MFFRRFFDRMQINLHLLGFHRLAQWMGRWATPALPSEVSVHDRPTMPDGYLPAHYLSDDPGIPGHFYDEDSPTQPRLQVLNFDPTFNNNEGIDVTKDLAFPTTKLDVN